jgi:hypothetical protein
MHLVGLGLFGQRDRLLAVVERFTVGHHDERAV